MKQLRTAIPLATASDLPLLCVLPASSHCQSSVLQQVLASLHKQTERADKLEAELHAMSSNHSTLATAVTQLHSILTRLSTAEETLKTSQTTLNTLTNTQHAHNQHLATHNTTLTQHAVTLKELQTNATLVVGTLERKADSSEVDKKASGLKVQQVERLVLQQAAELERLREAVRGSERECELMREQVADSASQRERLILVERDMQQHNTQLRAMRSTQDDWQQQLSAFETTESMAARVAAVEEAVSAAAREQQQLNKKEMKRFERDVVAYINQQTASHAFAHHTTHHAASIPSHSTGAASSSSASNSGHLHTGLTPLVLPSAPLVDSTHSAAATVVQLKCLSCSAAPVDMQGAKSLQLATATASADQPPLTERTALLHNQWVDSVTIGDQTYITGIDGNVYKGQRPHTADGGGRGGRQQAAGKRWEEEKEADVLTVAAADRSESMVFAEESRRKQTLEAKKRETGSSSVSNYKPQRLMVSGTGQIVRAPNMTDRELRSARASGSSSSRK